MSRYAGKFFYVIGKPDEMNRFRDFLSQEKIVYNLIGNESHGLSFDYYKIAAENLNYLSIVFAENLKQTIMTDIHNLHNSKLEEIVAKFEFSAK